MSRRNRVLAICAALAWGLLLAVERPWQGDAHARTAAAVGPLFPQLDGQRQELTRIVVEEEGRRTELVARRDEGRWYVVGKDHPADGRRVADLVDMLATLRTTDVVAEDPASHGIYGVAEGQGTRVRIYGADDRPLADWIHGKLREQDVVGGVVPVLEFYVRRGDRPEVYLTGDAILPSTDPARWCDTRFLQSIPDAAVEWVVREDFDGEESWRIERIAGAAVPEAQGLQLPASGSVGERWQMTLPTAVPAYDYAGDSLVRTLVTLRAEDVVARATPEDAARYGFPTDRFRAGIREGGATLEFELELGAPTPQGGRFLRVSGLPHVYVLSDFEVGQLRQPLDAMLEEQQ